MERRCTYTEQIIRSLIGICCEKWYLENPNSINVEAKERLRGLLLCASFARYFSSDHADPKKDMLLFTNCTLLLTDEDFSGFLSEINEVAVKYMKKEAAADSK